MIDYCCRDFEDMFTIHVIEKYNKDGNWIIRVRADQLFKDRSEHTDISDISLVINYCPWCGEELSKKVKDI